MVAAVVEVVVESNFHHVLCSDQDQTWFPLAHHQHPYGSVEAEVVVPEVVLVAQVHQWDRIPAWICHLLVVQVVALVVEVAEEAAEAKVVGPEGDWVVA